MKSLYARFVLFLIAPAIRAELARQARSSGDMEQFGKSFPILSTGASKNRCGTKEEWAANFGKGEASPKGFHEDLTVARQVSIREL